jgi:hypothetical protein
MPCCAVLCCAVQGYLKAFRAHSSSPRAHRASTGCLLSEQVTELKSYIQAVADAELDGNDDMIAITASHAAKYAVQLIRQSTDMACATSKVGPACRMVPALLLLPG